MLVNGHVEIDAVQLRELFGGTLKKISKEMKTEYRELTVNYFHPSPPQGLLIGWNNWMSIKQDDEVMKK